MHHLIWICFGIFVQLTASLNFLFTNKTGAAAAGEVLTHNPASYA